MKIALVSIPVHDTDQDKALKFYTEILGFEKKEDRELPQGMGRWLTLVEPGNPDGTQIVLEPAKGFPPAKEYYQKLYESGIPVTAFQVDDIQKEYNEMKEKGVEFKSEPAEFDNSLHVMFDDTCGNLVQMYQILS